jgi:hypothetical protein
MFPSSRFGASNNTDIVPPVLAMPVLSPSYLLNSAVTFTFSTDAQSGVASPAATLNGIPITSGTTLNSRTSAQTSR